jgi:hypothetical protein
MNMIGLENFYIKAIAPFLFITIFITSIVFCQINSMSLASCCEGGRSKCVGSVSCTACNLM